MKRRAFLGTLATTAFAGCTGYAGAGGEDPTDSATTTTDNSTTTEKPTVDSPERALEVTETDPAPVEDVEIAVTATANFTAEHPARLEFAFTNTADESRTFQFGSLVPWDGLRGDSQDGDGQLLLAPSDNVVPDDPEDGDCWRATDSIALPAVMRTEELDADETVSQEFHVLAGHESESCHEPGQYRFETGNYLGEEWGFTVEITEIALTND